MIDRRSMRFALDDAVDRVRDAIRGAGRQEADEASTCRAREDVFAFSTRYYGVGPVQRPQEIFGLLALAEERGTRTVCEIGSMDAGTSILFSRALRGVQQLCVLDLYVKNRWRLRRDAPEGQTVKAIDGDSHHPRTVQRLARALDGCWIDLLLIDGDHSFEGVRRDFLAYRRFVRHGGLIAFHDICDAAPGSTAYVGGVPEFWRQVRRYYPAREFVSDPEPSGLGIGVLTYDEAVPIDALIAHRAPRERSRA
jgi:cephalosporin hydroxylase